jgi:O-antigen ligase
MPDSIFNYGGTIAVIVALPALGIVAKFFGVSFQRITKWYLYASVFCVMIVVNSIFFPFIGGKDYFFRFAVELGLISWLLWWAFEAKVGEAKRLIQSTFKRPLVIAATAFVAVFELACLFALDAHAAFWSNYERGEGGFQMLHYYLFFLLLTMVLQHEDDWKNIFKFSLVAACGMILYGLFADMGWVTTFISAYAGGTPPTGWVNLLFQGRFEGSLGNPAYVAPYLMFSMFFAAYLWIGSKLSGALTAIKSWGYGILIVIFLFFFYLSQTRGAFIGLAAGVFLAVLYLAFAGSRTTRKWSIIALGVFIVLGLGVFAIRNEPFLNNIPGGRLLQISLSDSTAQTRFWVWGEAWHGFLEKPVFGWGPENFTAVFDKFFNPNFYSPGVSTETWFDRAHSVFFDYLSETGLVGLLGYLSMFVVFAWEFFRRKWKQVTQHGPHPAAHAFVNSLFLAMPVAYLVQGVAIFDVLPMYVCLFLFLAFSSYYFDKNKSAHHESHV